MKSILLVWRRGIMGNVYFFIIPEEHKYANLVRACNGVFIDHTREFPDLWHRIYDLNQIINEDKLSPFSTKQIKQFLDEGTIITEIINCGSLS